MYHRHPLYTIFTDLFGTSFLKRQCDRTLGSASFRQRWEGLAVIEVSATLVQGEAIDRHGGLGPSDVYELYSRTAKELLLSYRDHREDALYQVQPRAVGSSSAHLHRHVLNHSYGRLYL